MKYQLPLYIIALIGAAFLSVKPATAQTDERMASVDEIIVSARKRDENLQEVPSAVTAITEQAIEDLSILSVDDIARHTPGFSFSQAFGRATERPVVRGAGNILAGVQYGVEAGTAYFINGQYYAGDLTAIDMHQVERVEVIKGPQSALYGRNSYAGAVNFVMREPSDERTGRVTAEMAQHGQYQLYANLAGPLGERVDGSISVRHYEYGGEIKNALNNRVLGDEQSWSITGMLRFELSDAATLTTRLSYVEDDDGPRAFALYKSNNNNCYPGYRSNRYRSGMDNNENQYFCGVVPPADQATQDLDGTPFVGVERELLYGSAVLDIDVMNDHTLSTKFAYRDEERKTGSDSDHQLGSSNIGFLFEANLAAFNFTDIDETTDYSAEISIISPQDRRLRYLAGVFFYDYERDQTGQYFPEYTTFDFRVGGVRNFRLPTHRLNNTNEITNQAVFASIEYDITDKLTASVEARYADEEKTLVERASGGFLRRALTDPNTEIPPVVYSDPVSVSFDSFTPRVVVSYRANEDMMFYGSFAQGTKPGGVNGASGVRVGRPSYDEEEADALEFGARTSWLDGRVIANLSLYRNEISQYQLTTPIEDTSGGANAVTSIATNQGDVEIDGVELELRTFPADNVTFGMTYAWTDATFTRGCDEFQFVLTSGGFLMAAFDINDRSTWNRYRISNNGGVSPSSDPDNRYEAGKGDCSIKGHTVPMTSEHQMSAYMNMDFPMNNGMAFFINSDVTYESSKFVQVHNGMETGDTILVGMQAGLKGDNWSLRFFGRNLTDEDSIIMGTRWFDLLQGGLMRGTMAGQIPPSADTTGSPRANLRSLRSRGRQLGITLTHNF